MGSIDDCVLGFVTRDGVHVKRTELGKMLPQNLLVRRKAEERYESASRMVAERQRVEGVVMFEHRTDAAIERGLVRKAVAVKNAQLRNQVDERRAKLAALLEAEKSEYEREIEATFEPPEVVKQRCALARRRVTICNGCFL